MNNIKVQTYDWVAIVIALLTSLLLWAQSNVAVTIAAIAIAVVWVLNLLFRLGKIQLHKGSLTALLLVVSLGLTAAFQPALFPVFPACSDTPACTSAFMTWIALLIATAGPIMGYAMGIYNILLEKVLAKLLYQAQTLILPKGSKPF